jgi:hypothetical protein
MCAIDMPVFTRIPVVVLHILSDGQRQLPNMYKTGDVSLALTIAYHRYEYELPNQ